MGTIGLKQIPVSDLRSGGHRPSLSSSQRLVENSKNCVLSQKVTSSDNPPRDTSAGLSLFPVLSRCQTRVFWHMMYNCDWPALCHRFQIHKELRQGLVHISYSINSSYHDGTISNGDIAWVDVDAARNRRKIKYNKIRSRMIGPYPELLWLYLSSVEIV